MRRPVSYGSQVRLGHKWVVKGRVDFGDWDVPKSITRPKTRLDYAFGFVHVDVKYLPQMADESRRTYLFVAIDRATRWVYLEILPDKSARTLPGMESEAKAGRPQ